MDFVTSRHSFASLMLKETWQQTEINLFQTVAAICNFVYSEKIDAVFVLEQL